jgi:CubicO group peptidase (beta-lactamase class C family)
VRTEYSNTIAQATAYIEAQMAANPQIPGLAIALVDDQRVVWARGFGYANKADRVAATADTEYEICSISKLFAGTMIMQLSDQGLLDISDPLTKYIPAFSIGRPVGFAVTTPESITLRSILTHHSGIPGEILNGTTTGVPDPAYNDWLIEYLKGDYLAYPTGFMYDYSDVAMSLLSSVIASASGQTFEAYSDALFQTLGMDQTSFYRLSPKITGYQARSYNNGNPTPTYYINVTTAGSVVSSALDMAQLIRMVNAQGLGARGRVLKASTLEAMLTQTNSGMPLESQKIGLNWHVGDPALDYAGRLCWHNGAGPGSVGHLEILRDQKLGVVVLLNDAALGSVCRNIAQQTLKLALTEKAGINPPAAVPYESLAAWGQSRLDALQGTYVLSGSSVDAYMTVASTPGALTMTYYPSGTVTTVAPRANGRLSDPVSPTTEFEFTTVSGLQVIIAHRSGATWPYAEYTVSPALSAAWQARVGNYTAVDWVGVAGAQDAPAPVLSVAPNGMLVMRTDSYFVLMPVTDTLAYVRGLGQGKGAAAKVTTVGGQEQLQFMGVHYTK